MAKIKPAPKSFERWQLSLDEFLWSYGFTLTDFSIDFEKLFRQGVTPDKALQMILGLNNLPEEDIQEHYLEDTDTYLVPLLNEC
jgi:hypothetical protein